MNTCAHRFYLSPEPNKHLKMSESLKVVLRLPRVLQTIVNFFDAQTQNSSHLSFCHGANAYKSEASLLECVAEHTHGLAKVGEAPARRMNPDDGTLSIPDPIRLGLSTGQEGGKGWDRIFG